jgi:putative endonuclease
MKNNNNWFVYLLECNDGSYYCGTSNNVYKRIEKHNKGTASKYTRGRLPVKLVYRCECGTKSEALKRECQIKKMSRTEKQSLVNMFFSVNLQW